MNFTMACGNNIYKSGINPTKELIDQITKQIATRSVRDTDMEYASDLSGDEFIAIVQNGENKKVRIGDVMDMSHGVTALYGTTEHWNNAHGFIPEAGSMVIYSDYSSVEIDGETVNVPGIKIGSGNGYVQDLAFVGQDNANMLLAHIANDAIHTSPEEKAFWNNKLNVTDYREVVDDVLIFHRH